MVSSNWFFSVSEEKLDISRHLRQEHCSLFLDFSSSMTVWPFIASATDLEAPRSHCVKNVQIRSLFWCVLFRIQSECGKIRTRKNSVFGDFTSRVSLKFVIIFLKLSQFLVNVYQYQLQAKLKSAVSKYFWDIWFGMLVMEG